MYVTKKTLKNQLEELEHMRDNYLTLIQKNQCIPSLKLCVHALNKAIVKKKEVIKNYNVLEEISKSLPKKKVIKNLK